MDTNVVLKLRAVIGLLTLGQIYENNWNLLISIRKRNKAYRFSSSRTHNWRQPIARTVKCVTESHVAPKTIDQGLFKVPKKVTKILREKLMYFEEPIRMRVTESKDAFKRFLWLFSCKVAHLAENADKHWCMKTSLHSKCNIIILYIRKLTCWELNYVPKLAHDGPYNQLYFHYWWAKRISLVCKEKSRFTFCSKITT